jgi:2-polyprenyl-3-methyl-5-hydroxy-6-metoxy-1,4-benzoquinol methylase
LRSVDASVTSLLRCPVCKSDTLAGDARLISCHRCDHRFPRAEGGYFDLIDFEGATAPATPAQRFMESELVARIYERFFRPFMVRTLAGPGAAGGAGGFSGELFLHKNALGMDERTGAWLDLSCGPGLFTRAMAAASPGQTIVGLDLSRPMLAEAGKRTRAYPNVTLVRANAQELPLADRRFVGVNNAGALHVYDDPEAAFTEIFRVLQPRGVYVGSTFAPASRALGRITSRLTGIRRFDPHELRAWLSRIGFHDYEEIRLGDAFVFKARKP